MRFHALATDYDGTLAEHGKVSDSTIAALETFRKSGRRTIMVTGRELTDLRTVFERFDLFDCVVAENGALLYWPATGEEEPLAPPPPVPFIEALQAKGVHPLSVGKVIVATWHPNENAVLDTIREQGLELQVIFNKGAVMILPSGFNKARGLAEALKRMKLSAHNVVAVGDAENDMAMLNEAEIGAAVENALPSVKEAADIVLTKDHGPGVEELIAQIVSGDLAKTPAREARKISIAHGVKDEAPFSFPPYGGSILLAGTSGGGKSTFATAFLEALTDAKYQFCVIDPEGDYEVLEGAIVLGNAQRAPEIEEILQVLSDPSQNLVINLLGKSLNDRPAFFQSLLPQFMELRRRHGRPHWLIVDEAHHMLPADREAPEKFPDTLFITVHPKSLAQSARNSVTHALAVGQKPYETLGRPGNLAALEPGHALAWKVGEGEPVEVKVVPPRGERRRHKRKYASGTLGEDKSFYFRGPEGKLKLRAQNLMLFLQMGDGVDDETWDFHFSRGDFSKWFREQIKDNALAEDAEKVEHADLGVPEARKGIREAVERHYTAPAE